jgi:hypothetical protein
MDIESHFPLLSSRIGHKRWVDHNKDNNRKTFEPKALLILLPYSVSYCFSLRPSSESPLVRFFKNYTKTVPRNQGSENETI